MKHIRGGKKDDRSSFCDVIYDRKGAGREPFHPSWRKLLSPDV